MAEFSRADVRLFVRYIDRKIEVTVLGGESHETLEIPAAMATTESGSVLYFEDAVAARQENKAESFEWIEHPFEDQKFAVGLNALILNLVEREDVLALGTGERYIVLCSSYRKTGETASNYRRPTCLIPRSTNHFLFTSEEQLYGKGSGFSDGFTLNLTGDFTNLVFGQNIRGYVAGPGFDNIVNSFIKMLCLKGYDLTDSEGQLFCRELVSKYCYVALDLDSEIELVEKNGGVLHEIVSPKGTTIELGKECFLAPECLFDPGLVGLPGPGVGVWFHDVSALLNEGDEIPVLLCGYFNDGLVGFGERLHSEIAKSFGSDLKLHIQTASSLQAGAFMIRKSEFPRTIVLRRLGRPYTLPAVKDIPFPSAESETLTASMDSRVTKPSANAWASFSCQKFMNRFEMITRWRRYVESLTQEGMVTARLSSFNSHKKY